MLPSSTKLSGSDNRTLDSIGHVNVTIKINNVQFRVFKIIIRDLSRDIGNG